MAEPIPVETTYADLREGEVIVDKSGNHWTAVGVAKGVAGANVAFALAADGVKQHYLSKPYNGPVTVLRAPSRDDDIARREAEIDACQVAEGHIHDNVTGEVVTEADAERRFAETLGGEVLAEESAEVEAQREAAEADSSKPMALPPFSEFTDLEKRSHLFLVHGVYAHDVKSRKRLDELHDEDHARGEARDGHVFTAHAHDGTMPA